MLSYLKTLGVGLGTVVFLAGATVHAKSKPGLEPFGGSYTGTAVATTAAGTIAGSATLTFTGKKNGLRGTFLYTGILNSGNAAQNVVQTLTISKSGAMSGRVTVDGVDGSGAGQARLKGRRLTVTVTYVVGVAPSTTTINLTGTITFKGRRAGWTATVSSSDPADNGTLSVVGKR